MKINLKQLIKKPKTIQKIQEKTIEEYKVMKKDELSKICKKYLNKEVKFEINQ